MKGMEVAEYPDAFIEASVTFLKNPTLLTAFVSIVFKKTK